MNSTPTHPESPPLVSVVVVTLNARALLERCLAALAGQTYPRVEVIVVDNGSTDDIAAASAAALPAARLVRLPTNTGFAGGNNRGIEQAGGEFIALLNNDAVASPTWLAAMVRRLQDHPRAGAIACVVEDGNRPGTLDSYGVGVAMDGMSRQRLHGQPLTAVDRGGTGVLAFSGCACLLRRAALAEVGCFEERFFAYCEDTDLSLRLQRAGWDILAEPGAHVRHDYSQTGGAYSVRKVFWVERNHFWVAWRHLPAHLLLWLPLATAWRYTLQACYLLAGRRSSLQGFVTNNGCVPIVRAILGAHRAALAQAGPMFAARRTLVRRRTAREWRTLLARHRLGMRELLAPAADAGVNAARPVARSRRAGDPLRIAVVTPTFPPYRGGMGVVAQQDATQLAALGHAVDVLVAQPAAASTDAYRVRPLHAWFRYGNAAFVPGLAHARRDYDLITLQYPFYGGAEPLAFAPRHRGDAPLVLTYQMDTVGHGLLGLVFRLHAALVRPLLLRRADHLLVNSFDYAAHSGIRGMLDTHADIISEMPPSVDTDRFSPGPRPAELAARLGLRDHAPVILFVGGLDRAHYFKGVHNLVRALAASGLERAHAVIVGQGALQADYAAAAQALGVGPRVHFAGGVTDAELPAFHRLADVFAFPSLDRSEAFGIAALEAMSAGVPVVASNLPGVRTIVRAGVTGQLVRPGDVDDLARTLGALLGNVERRQAMGRAGRAMAVTEYSVARRTQRWRELLERLSPR